MMIPKFSEVGTLPPGDYAATFDELRQSVLVLGPPSKRSPSWDSSWRLHLVDRLEALVLELWQVGITEIYADGSFAEEKDHPNDIDGYFECDRMAFLDGHVERKLNLLNPQKVWTWDPNDRWAYQGYPKEQLPMWHHYRVELWPHFGQGSGIQDEHGNELTFPAAFRKSRDNNRPRGIVKIIQ
jgi:hypothetical protein